MRAASVPFYEPRWSSLIHDEWTRNLLADRPDLKPEQIARTRLLMETAFPSAMVTGYELRIEALALPDPDDRHVLAAAIETGAGVIVTANLRHFPASYLSGFGVEPLHPDAFAVGLYEAAPADFVEMAREHRARLKKPPKSAEEYLATFERNQLTRIAALLARHREEI